MKTIMKTLTTKSFCILELMFFALYGILFGFQKIGIYEMWWLMFVTIIIFWFIIEGDKIKKQIDKKKKELK